jgi:CheY-like chemotaxis protein
VFFLSATNLTCQTPEALQVANSFRRLLPRLGGTQLLQLLKRDPLTSKIPVIVLRSLPQKNELKLIAEGAAAYLEKSKSLDTKVLGSVAIQFLSR